MLKRLAVLGHPVAHSRSPAMQTAALAALGLEGQWSYEAIEVDPSVFEDMVRSMQGQGFAGANVTVPHKTAALELADEASTVAREIGAANTLLFDDGEIRAENTDAVGLLASLPVPTRGEALVLGAGGAARAAVWALRGAGMRVSVWNRTASRARELCGDLGARAEPEPEPSGYDLIVNATVVGLEDEDPFDSLPLAASSFREGQVIVDMVYGDAPTALLRAATLAGAQTVDGLEILVRQGAESLRLWTGLDAPLDVMRVAARAA